MRQNAFEAGAPPRTPMGELIDSLAAEFGGGKGVGREKREGARKGKKRYGEGKGRGRKKGEGGNEESERDRVGRQERGKSTPEQKFWLRPCPPESLIKLRFFHHGNM